MLNTSSGVSPYSVITSRQFLDDWRQAVAGGFVAPEREASLLELIREMLADDPYRYPLFPSADEPVDMRWFDLHGGRQDPKVEVWYSILEDDRVVHLVAVAVIHTQPGFALPGFAI